MKLTAKILAMLSMSVGTCVATNDKPDARAKKFLRENKNNRILIDKASDQNIRELQQECTAYLQITDNGSNKPDSKKIVCEMDGSMHPVNWSEQFVQDLVAKGFHSGNSRMKLAGLEIKQGAINAPQDAALINKGNGKNQRKLAITTGTRTVLGVRVVALDGSYAFDETELSNNIFGNNGADLVNLASQYAACSNGAFTIAKSSNRINGAFSISNGVTTVSVATSITQGDITMTNAITAALNANFGVASPTDLANHVMYCLPAGTIPGGGIAYAYINHWMSVYSNEWCNFVSAQMHEIGHNLNLAHSNEGIQAYGDQTGMMGFSYADDDGPIMCFNAAKSWQLGWYSSKSVVVDASTNPYWSGQLAGISDYGTTANNVLIKINSPSSKDYYVNFNRKFGINSGTVEAGNLVTVVQQDGEGSAYAESDLVAKLSANSDYFVSNFIPGKDLTVSVGEIGSTASVSVRIGAPSCNVDADCSECSFCNVAKQCESLNLPAHGQLKVGLKTDMFAAETSWSFMSPTGAILASGNTYSNTAEYSIVHNISTICGAHYFTIYDSYGDGICCTWGQGSYNVSWNGVLQKSGGSFGSRETTAIAVKGDAAPTRSPAPSAAPSACQCQTINNKSYCNSFGCPDGSGVSRCIWSGNTQSGTCTRKTETSSCTNCNILAKSNCQACSNCIWKTQQGGQCVAGTAGATTQDIFV